MRRFTGLHTGLVMLIILAFLLTGCGGNATPADCLKRSDSQKWLQDAGSLLGVWNDEVELVGLASRNTAAEASRELRNTRRDLKQLKTPDCLASMRDEIILQMTGVLASLDAWIREDGAGLVFSTAGKLNISDFQTQFVTDTTLVAGCQERLDPAWIQDTAKLLADWESEVKWSGREEARANANAILARLEQDAVSDCAKAAVLGPVMVWVRGIQTGYDRVLEENDAYKSLMTLLKVTEDVDSIFLAIANEYIDLQSQTSR